MAHIPSLRWWRHALALVLLALPATAAAQISPTTPAHPNLPWGIGVATPQGQLIRYIYVPPQPVTLQYLVPGAPESAPPAAEPTPPSVAAAPPGPVPAPPSPAAAPPSPAPTPPSPAAAPPSPAPAPPSPAADAKPPEDTAGGESVPAAPQIVNQQVTIPGYYVRETTAGFHYPDRWTIEQVGPNTYRWRPLPAQFVPK
jgi:hypothetical protein